MNVIRRTPYSQDHVVIIGAGMAGLAAALKLTARGVPVTVIEKQALPGGKIRQAMTPLGPIDLGPTVLTMRWVFDDLLENSGQLLEQHLEVIDLDVLAHHRWTDGSRLDLHADPERNLAAIAEFAGSAEARRFERFQAMAKNLHEALRDSFMRVPSVGLSSMLRKAGLSGMVSIGRARPHSSLWNRLGDYFHDPRLRQLYARYATYCGSSPFAAPATLMLIAAVEQSGVWRVRHGVLKLAIALERVATGLGARFLYGRKVSRIELANGTVNAVVLEDGERMPVSRVILNADLRDVVAGGFGSGVAASVNPARLGERSLSAVTWHGVVRSPDPALHLHNVFFSADYGAEFEDLFRRRCLPRNPTVYLCASDRPRETFLSAHMSDPKRKTGAATAAIQARAEERMFMLINAPAEGDNPALDWSALAEAAAERVRLQLDKCGLVLEREISDFKVTTPREFEQLFPSTGGALYGSATHGWQAAFKRPDARSRIPGLYLAGGGVHPGPGVPMAALSGMAAASVVLADLEAHSRHRSGSPVRG